LGELLKLLVVAQLTTKMKSIFTTIVSALSIARAVSQSLPQVDLGYEIHQAITYNVRITPDGLERT